VLSALLTLIRAFGSMCLLRLRPQDIPASPVLLAVTLVSYLGANVAVSLLDTALVEALVLVVLGTLLGIVLTVAALYLRRHAERITQTLTALLGTGVVMSVPAYALRRWFSLLQAQDLRSELAVHLWILVFIWNLLIMAHILRHALSTRFVFGFFIAVGYVFVLFRFLVAVQPLFSQAGA
jgi:hypothetical protein